MGVEPAGASAAQKVINAVSVAITAVKPCRQNDQYPNCARLEGATAMSTRRNVRMYRCKTGEAVGARGP